MEVCDSDIGCFVCIEDDDDDDDGVEVRMYVTVHTTISFLVVWLTSVLFLVEHWK